MPGSRAWGSIGIVKSKFISLTGFPLVEQLVGWGRYSDQSYPEELQEASLPVVTVKTCQRAHPSLEALVKADSFCAGYRNGKGSSSMMLTRRHLCLITGLYFTQERPHVTGIVGQGSCQRIVEGLDGFCMGSLVRVFRSEAEAVTQSITPCKGPSLLEFQLKKCSFQNVSFLKCLLLLVTGSLACSGFETGSTNVSTRTLSSGEGGVWAHEQEQANYYNTNKSESSVGHIQIFYSWRKSLFHDPIKKNKTNAISSLSSEKAKGQYFVVPISAQSRDRGVSRSSIFTNFSWGKK